MDALMLRTFNASASRSATLQPFAEYIAAEAKNCSQESLCSVDTNGTLLEYETLELRLHPPEVCVNNNEFQDKTVLTIDSANRPGTLVEVVQCLTELGLNIQRARISSDGGWFVDEFYITESSSGKVVNPKKLAVIEKVLSVHYEMDSAFALEDGNSRVTLVELSGPDRVGIFDEVVDLVTGHGCEVRSAAVWTCRRRVAIVMSITEGGAPIHDRKCDSMKPLLANKLNPSCPSKVHVHACQVSGVIHYERRLHQLMLQAEEAAWESCYSSNTATSPLFSQEGPDAPSLAFSIQDLSPCSEDSLPAVPVLTHDDMDPEYRSSKFSAPEVSITECKVHKYWVVNIKTKDRHKLFFDTVCTLADLRYDVFHGSIDCENGMAHQVYYCRQRNGDPHWNEVEVSKLKYMLQVSIQRRYPKGLKVHVHEVDRHVLAKLTATFKNAGFCITRAMVRPYSGKGGHTFHLLEGDNHPPERSAVVEVCQGLGGQMVKALDEVENDFMAGPSDDMCLMVNQPATEKLDTLAFLFSSNFPCVSLSPTSSTASTLNC